MKEKKNVSDTKVVVLGAGVIGLTTALILKLHGFKVTIVTKDNFDQLNSVDLGKHPPELASIHAAASIIPHSVNHPSEREILEISQNFFHHLAFSASFGVRIQRHYELHEEVTQPPEYARTVKDFHLLPHDGSGWVNDHSIPRRKGAKGIYGWYFNAFFIEVPIYMEALKNLCLNLGVKIVPKALQSKTDIENINADIIVNCLGRWSVNFFPEDKKNTKIIRGHMVKVGVQEVPHDLRGQYFSYNYYPDKSIYSRKHKRNGETIEEKADVYFYPRSDGWLLGGSRQEGFPEVGESWREEDEQTNNEPYINKKKGWKYEIPKPIWELNRELILDVTGVDIADKKYLSFSYIGYRFGRDIIRIEEGNELENKNKLLIHNYGHGGAGYTLSWGCAYMVLGLIEERTKLKTLKTVQKKSSKNYWETFFKNIAFNINYKNLSTK